LVEHQLWELAVAGSNPVAPTIFIILPRFRRSLHGIFISLFAFRLRVANILSAAQNETEMAGCLEQHQIINTVDKPLQTGRFVSLRLAVSTAGITAAKRAGMVQPDASAVE
jgi:hypothetical protein